MSVVDEIKERLDIVDVISDYVPLKKAGRNYKALCPFHAEKTPSFIVFPDTQTWHCFGACGTGGDVFTFIMKRENLSFAEALRLLAQRAGVPLRPKTEAETAEEELKKRLREINAAAATYFHHLLLASPEGERARKYLAKRGINQETIEKFQLGYALSAWEALKKYLTGKGYRLADIKAAGLLVEREDGSSYDRFRGRLMIPIRDLRGSVVGFGARVLDAPPRLRGGQTGNAPLPPARGGAAPKYLNSPQTPLFDKSSLLFGLDLAKGAILAQGLAVIVEGYMDVLTAHQHGFANVVASMGTALTEAQLKLLKRFSKRFALALDADRAGSEATLRGLALAREALDRQVVPVPTPRGLIRYESRLSAEIRIITLPQGTDPDEVIKADPARWAELVEKALPVVDYYFQVVTAGLDLNSPKGKAEAVRRLMPIIQEIGDPVERTHYLQKLARLVRVDEKTLLLEAAAGRAKAPRKVEEEKGAAPRPPFPKSAIAFGLEEYCLSALLRRPHLLRRLDGLTSVVGVKELSPDDFAQVENREIFAALRDRVERGGELDMGALREALDATLHPRLDALLEGPPGAPAFDDEELAKGLAEGVLRLRKRNLERLIQELRFLAEEAEEQGEAAVRELGQKVDAHRAALRRIHRALAARSVIKRWEVESLGEYPAGGR